MRKLVVRSLFPLVAFSAMTLAQDAPVGIVTLAQGEAKLFQPGIKNPAKVEIADVLPIGSRIVTATGKVNFVSCVQSVAAQVQPNSDVVFTATGYEAKKGSVTQQHKVASCHVAVASVGGPNAHIGGVNMRGDSSMRLISPVSTAVDPSQVTFRWQVVEGATIYRVALRDASGNDFWEREVNVPGNSADYSGDKSLSAGASYRWRVTALQGDEVLSSASAKMETFTADDLARIAAIRKQSTDANESHLLLGMLYEELNSPEMALAEYEKVRGESKSGWLAAKISGLKKAEGQ